jgi:hypothetical protein
VYAFARVGKAEPAERDRSLRDALSDYVAKSNDMLARIDRMLREQIGAEPVLVWGVGQLTMRLLGETCLGRAHIAAFIDSNPVHQGRTLADKPVISPDSLANGTMGNASIVIGSLVNGESIEASIRERGLAQRVLRLDGKGNQ